MQDEWYLSLRLKKNYILLNAKYSGWEYVAVKSYLRLVYGDVVANELRCTAQAKAKATKETPSRRNGYVVCRSAGKQSGDEGERRYYPRPHPFPQQASKVES